MDTLFATGSWPGDEWQVLEITRYHQIISSCKAVSAPDTLLKIHMGLVPSFTMLMILI